MTREEFQALTEKRIIILDGATGTNLQKAGMPTGVCPEQWILEHRDVMFSLQQKYVDAGTDILYAPTFTANRIKLSEYGLEDKIGHMNQELVRISKEAAQGKALVAGDLTMTGEQLYPIGTLTFEELVEVYKEQIMYQLLEGVDLFVTETMMSLQECRAAVLAVKETCDLPVMVTMTFGEDGRTLYGTNPETAVIVMEHMGVDAVGVNCSTGPEKMREIIRIMQEVSYIPIIAKPNAGIPILENGKTVFNMGPVEFGLEMAELITCGAGILGGCCGTTPEHIRQLKECSKGKIPQKKIKQHLRILTTERNAMSIDLDGSFLVVGERINPTGKKVMQAQIKEGNYELVRQMAEEQFENGASVLDVNMGMNGIDEKEVMCDIIQELSGLVNIPLCIDSSYPEVVEAALRLYPGRALINSISLEKGKMEKLLPAAKKYGAMFIVLPVSETGLPKDLEEKKSIIRTILEEAEKEGLQKEDVVVDGLVATIGANKKAALETLETIKYCKNELSVATICGLSNISFGLPERIFVNSTFLAFAITAGLTMAIANPSQDLLMNTAFAADLLNNRKEADLGYIERVTKTPIMVIRKEELEQYEKQDKTSISAEQKQEYKQDNRKKHPVWEDVLKGNKRSITRTVEETLKEETKPSEIINKMLIPAINEVGELFDKQIYFLPQLISSAEAMKIAIDYLEPMLKQEGNTKELGTIIIATVAGDIHDIGKNLVALMLKNYGFRVLDLGKDVPTEVIIHTAKEEKADIIALSALMTTTMMEMKQVVDQARKENLPVKIMIGGAVITQSFADEIGADGYSKDASEAVKLAKKLLNLSE